MGFTIVMEEFSITIWQEQQAFDYRIINKQTDLCEFEVYLEEVLMAVFEPDEEEYIHICRNPGGLDEEVIVQIADGIEAHLL
jgi:predicted HicB family RNase H-like nuclease